MFDRCQRSWAVGTPDKYERELIYLPNALEKKIIFQYPVTEIFANRALVTGIPDHNGPGCLMSKWYRQPLWWLSCDWNVTMVRNIYHVRILKRQYRAYHFQVQDQPRQPMWSCYFIIFSNYTTQSYQTAQSDVCMKCTLCTSCFMSRSWCKLTIYSEQWTITFSY